jgi:hypothetical protein
MKIVSVEHIDEAYDLEQELFPHCGLVLSKIAPICLVPVCFAAVMFLPQTFFYLKPNNPYLYSTLELKVGLSINNCRIKTC